MPCGLANRAFWLLFASSFAHGPQRKSRHVIARGALSPPLRSRILKDAYSSLNVRGHLATFSGVRHYRHQQHLLNLLSVLCLRNRNAHEATACSWRAPPVSSQGRNALACHRVLCGKRRLGAIKGDTDTRSVEMPLLSAAPT